jgi:hypothetical protein
VGGDVTRSWKRKFHTPLEIYERWRHPVALLINLPAAVRLQIHPPPLSQTVQVTVNPDDHLRFAKKKKAPYSS